MPMQSVGLCDNHDTHYEDNVCNILAAVHEFTKYGNTKNQIWFKDKTFDTNINPNPTLPTLTNII